MNIILSMVAGLLFMVVSGILAMGGWLILGFTFFMLSMGCIVAPLLFHKEPKATGGFSFNEPEVIEIRHRHEHHHHNYTNISEGTEISQELPDGRMITTRHVKRWQ